MPRYLEILAIQTPFPYGVDESKRVLFSCNFMVMVTYPAPALEENIITILIAAGIPLVLNTNVFIGPSSGPSATVLDSLGAAPYTTLIATGGTDPLETHDDNKYDRPRIQTITRALSFTSARSRAMAIYAVLDGARNITV